ncbi:MAG: hypothetical protein KJ826_06290, partial [Proteobacteria bacterium]|nr:hypothetical protein [Pseudomonadota bacterium]
MIKLINILFYLGIILCFFTTGCLKHVPVLITSDPSGAQIYRGSKNQKKLYMASGTTPHTYNVSKKPPLYLDEWYTKFMVKKEGYEDSEIQKADGNIDRLHFVLKPLHSANLKDIEQAKNILKAEAYKNNNADIPDFDSQINKLCSQISEEMSGNNKTTVAVFEFSDLDGNVSELGKYIS